MPSEEGATEAFETCGVRIDAVSLDDAAVEICRMGIARRGRSVHLCNAYVLSLARQSAAYAAVLNCGDLNLADGAPVAWLGRLLGFERLRERPSGAELMLETMRTGLRHDVAHYLYGASPVTVARLAQCLRDGVPGVRIVGVESPPFRQLTEDEETELVERILGSGAGVVWVGLGTPKQDRFVERFRDRVPAVLVPVGAAFDFLSGAKSRAPNWMRRAGLEWVHRLKSEPRRLWRRYLVGNTTFLLGALVSTRRKTQRS